MTIRDLWQSHNLLKTVIYVSISALLFVSIATIFGLKSIDIEDVLILCGGLSNLIAVIDISRHPKLVERGPENMWVRVALTAELFILAWIIGFDVGHIIKNDFWRMALSVFVVILIISIVAFFDFLDNIKTGILIFGLLLSGAVHTNAEIIESVIKDAPNMIGRLLSSVMHEDSSLLGEGDIKNLDSLVNKLRNSQDPPSNYLRTQITPDTKRLLDFYDASDKQAQPLQQALLKELNQVIQGPSLYDDQRFGKPEIRPEFQSLFNQYSQGTDHSRLNRWLLQRAYPYEIAKRQRDSYWDWIADRLHAWVHLLLIPFMYFVVDSFLKDKPMLGAAKRAIPLDRAICIVGFACAVAGFKVGNPLFEAGAVAAVLLLGNSIYVSYVHKAVGQPDPSPQLPLSPHPEQRTDMERDNGEAAKDIKLE